MTCPHCPATLEPHDGMTHCGGCGCYFRDGVLDPAHTACRDAANITEPTPEPAEPEQPAADKPARTRRAK